MWGNIILSSFYSNNSLTFASSKSDVLIHLVQWQYWWWFWFSIFFIFYYNIAVKVIIFRSLKFYPKINTSMRPRGRWGDMIIAIIPIYWCTNILINSNSLLKVMEWQDSSSLITVRVRGRQWYWVYKLSSLSNINVVNVDILLGNNSTFSLNNLYSSEQSGNLFDFWLRWNNKFYLKKIFTGDAVSSFFLKEGSNPINSSILGKSKYTGTSVFVTNQKSSGSSDFSKTPSRKVESVYSGTSNYLNTSDINSSTLSNYIVSFTFNKKIKFNTLSNYKYLLLTHGSYELPVNFKIFNLYSYYNPNLSNFYLFGGNFDSSINAPHSNKSFNSKNHISVVKSYKPEYCVNLLFSEPDTFSRKPRYYLTLRQKPVKDWFSYLNNGVDITYNSSLYSNISKSIKTYVGSYQTNFNLLNSNRLLNTTTTLVLPTNKTISIISNSFDVVHSWFVPGLGIKIDCVPGRSTHHILKIDVPGFYYGQCAEICGRFHHHMPIKICALVFEHFLLWWQHYFMYLNLADNWADSLKISRSRYSKFFK